MLDGLAGGGVATIPVDLPGHGSDAGRSELEAFRLDATLGRIRESAPERYDLVGYSMGGRLALHLALRDPRRIRRLVLESASPGLASDDERARRRQADTDLAARLLSEGMEAFVDRWEALPLFSSQRRLPDDVRREHRRGRLANHPASLAASLKAVGTAALPSLWDRLPEVAAPTLVLAGALDRKFVDIGRRMADRLPDARLVVVERAGHTVHLERPDAWVNAVAEFLTEQATG